MSQDDRARGIRRMAKERAAGARAGAPLRSVGGNRFTRDMRLVLLGGARPGHARLDVAGQFSHTTETTQSAKYFIDPLHFNSILEEALSIRIPSAPPTPLAASRATASAPTRCRSRSSASAPSRSCRRLRASRARHTESTASPRRRVQSQPMSRAMCAVVRAASVHIRPLSEIRIFIGTQHWNPPTPSVRRRGPLLFRSGQKVDEPRKVDDPTPLSH